MRILYDGQIYALQTTGGVSRYFNNLISRLPESFIPTINSIYRRKKPDYPVHPKLKISKYFRFPPRNISSKLEKYYFRYINAHQQFDLAHPTFYWLFTKQEISDYKCPVIITIYDMIHEIFSEQEDPTGQYSEAKKKAVLAAQAIVCVSENTKRDLLERYSIPESKVTVTYLASGIDVSLSHGSESVPVKPYYLYVGRRETYKNFDALLLAFSKVISVHSDVDLCVVGSPFNTREINLIRELKLTNSIKHYSHVNDSHLAKLYRCSVAFVYPSLYEGFGIPPLEAMSCGTAVVASNASSIPEVVGDAGLLFDPQSPSDLADILLFLLDNSIERDRLVIKGYERAKEFSWDRTAAQTVNVYRSIIR